MYMSMMYGAVQISKDIAGVVKCNTFIMEPVVPCS